MDEKTPDTYPKSQSLAARSASEESCLGGKDKEHMAAEKGKD
jgi:hypothetical protein